MHDLIVIGGGPAGAASAITAAEAGRRVLWLERGRLPRHKVCGEFVSAESLELLDKLLGPRSAEVLRPAVRIRQARVYVDGRVLRTPVDPPAASIARLELDSVLWQAGLAAGVDARQEVTVQSVCGTRPMQVITSAGEFEAQAVINASGRWSNLNAAPAGNGKARSRWIGLKAHFAEPSPPDSVDLYFFEGGYCGVQPVNLSGDREGRVNACAMVQADTASTLSDVLTLHPGLQERSRGWRALSAAVSTSPLLFLEPRPERDGILMAGDAAGFVDPFVGDGISLALRGGTMAARSLLPFFAGHIGIEEARTQYVQSYQREFVPVFRAAARIRGAMRIPRAVRKPIVAVLQNTPAITRYLVKKTR